MTTYTAVEDYLPYRVPEVWLLSSGLEIYSLQEATYQPQARSRYFPTIELVTLTANVLQTAAAQGTGAALRALRQQFNPAALGGA